MDNCRLLSLVLLMFSIFCIGRIDRQTPGNAICQDAPCTNSCHLSHLVCSLLYRLYDFQRMDTQADRYDRHSSVLATAEPYTGNVAAENAASFDFLISHLCDAFLSYEIIQTRHRTHLLWQRYHRNDHIHITANYDFVLNNTYRTRLD